MVGRVAKLIPVARITFTLALAISQFIFFGIPALEKFSSAVVGEAKLVEKGEGLRPPAVSFCPFKYNYQGWKEATKESRTIDDQSYHRWCNSPNNTADFEACIEEKTFGLNDTVVFATKGWHGENITGPQFWTTDVSTAMNGRCYTLDIDVKLGIDAMTEGIMIDLNENLTYTVFVHQPDLYRFAYNPATMPMGVQKIISLKEIGRKYFGFFLELVRRERLNRAESPCNPDPGYKFNSCIKQSLSDTIGCKLPWDKLSKGHRACSKGDEFDLFEKNYFKLARMDQAFVENHTGCLFPCTYDEYRVVATDLRDFNIFGVVFTYGSLGTTVLREYLIYPFDSLVSDFGGTLGLFVGFSFVTLWDLIQLFITFCCHKLN